MFKVLLRTRLASLGAWFSGATRSRKQSSTAKTVLFTLLMLYVLGCVAFMMFGVFSQIAGPFSQAGLSWLYFTMFAIMDISLMVISSVFMAKSQIYEAKDNELLLAMPLKPADILASRMAMLFVVDFACGLLVAVPAVIAWNYKASAPLNGGQWFAFVLIALALIFVSLALSCLLAWLLSLITSRVRKKSLIDTVISLIFLAAYFYVINQMNTMIAALATEGESLAVSLGSVAPLYWIGSAIAQANVSYLLLILAICLIPFILVYILLSSTFIKTATMKRGFAKIKYVDKGQKVSSVQSALYGREMSRFLSSSGYILNAGMGVVFMVVAAGFMLIKKEAVIGFMSENPNIVPIILPLVALGLCAFASMTTISAPSVSIEGKTLWIAQSLPVSSQEILKSKLKLHLRLLLPATIVCIISSIEVFKPTGIMLVILILLPIIFSVYTAVLGLMANLKHPYFDWTNETQAVKSSISVIIAIFGSWGTILLPVIALFVLPDVIASEIVMIVFTVLVAFASFEMYKWITTKGADIYSKL